MAHDHGEGVDALVRRVQAAAQTAAADTAGGASVTSRTPSRRSLC